MENPHLEVSLLTFGYNINFDQNSVVLNNTAPPTPDTNSTKMPPTSSTTSVRPGTTEKPTTTLDSVPTSRISSTSAVTMDDSQLMFSIWVLIGCVLATAVLCILIAVVVCGCLYFGLRYRRKCQVSEDPVSMLKSTCQRSFSEGNLSTHRDEEKTVLGNGSQPLPLPYRNSYVYLNTSTPSIPQSNGNLSGAVSQDSCRGSYDPLVSKPNSPTHSSTTV